MQDAFGGPGVFQDEGPNELLVLDVIGYTLAHTPPPAPPVLTIVPSGANQVTLAWSNSYTGFVLQERAAFTNGTWAAAASGGNNPAVASATAPQKFFRLFKAAPSGIHPRPAELSAPTQRRLVTHRLLPRQP